MHFSLDAACDLLVRMPRVLRARLEELAAVWVLADEGAETFSAFEVLGHLIHGERSDWMPRLRLILEHGPDVTFEPYDRFAQRQVSAGRSVGELLTEFEELRAVNLADLRALDLGAADLARSGVHPELGPVTARQLLATWVVHDQSHLAQISRVFAHQYAEEVGPWRQYLRVLEPR